MASFRPFIVAALAGLFVAPAATGASAAAVRVATSCPVRTIGAVSNDKSGQPLVCTRVTKTKAQWKLPPLGSLLRPIPLGQASEAGPTDHRFSVHVTRVALDATAEVTASDAYATPPAPGSQYVRIEVAAAFRGPAASGSTEHVWSARDGAGASYTASQGCGGGFGTDFDVAALVKVGESITGAQCFEVPSASVASLLMRVDGYGSRPDVYFAVR